MYTTNEAAEAVTSRETGLAKASARVGADDGRKVTVEVFSTTGEWDAPTELGTVSIQDATALTFFLEYHRDYDYSRAAAVRVEDFGPISFDELHLDRLYPADHDELNKADLIAHELLVFLDCCWEREDCFLRYSIH